MKIEKLVEKVKDKNKEDFIKLIEPIRNDLYRIALSKLRNEEDAKDAVQETIMKAYLAIKSGKEIKNFKAWITKVLINECKSIYKEHKRNNEIDQKCIVSEETIDYLDDDLSFYEIIDNLEGTAKEIFELYYKHGLTIKLIAKKLGMSESNVKAILSRGRVKLRKLEKRTTLFIAILCILITTSVIAISLIKYIQGLFELDSVGKNNDGVQIAIEHMEWYQDVDMEYIDIGEGNKIRAEYLLMDEMNLYIVFDIKCEKDISKFTDVSFPDLRIVDENNNVICDESNLFAEHYGKSTSAKVIENNKDNMKVLVYMYTDNFPKSTSLNIGLSKIIFLKKSLMTKEQLIEISANAEFNIELADKFINRNSITYNSENSNIEKAIITETGFYAIVKQDWNDYSNDVQLSDEKGKQYKSYLYYLNTDKDIEQKCVVISDCIDVTNNRLKLTINGYEYKLIKED